jgi:nicotinamidase/pyrazinamidase
MSKCLIVVDMQNDYCEGGPMAFDQSLGLIPKINRIRDHFEIVIFATDVHPDNHISFKKYGGKLPEHCVVGSYGSQIHQDLIVKPLDYIITRGTLPEYDSESIFYNADSIENISKLKTILVSNKIKNLYFCGNGLDSIIFSSIIDAINYKFDCCILIDLVTFTHKFDECIKYLESIGAKIVNNL